MTSMYEILESVCALCNNQTLNDKLNRKYLIYLDLMTSKKTILEKSMINFKDFLNFLRKKKDLLRIEKLWVMFKFCDCVRRDYVI